MLSQSAQKAWMRDAKRLCIGFPAPFARPPSPEVTEDPSGALAVTTTYSYDVLDNLQTVDQGSVDRAFTYDTLSQLRQAINPESGTTIYTYRKDGTLETRTDARQVKLTNSYNPLGQLQGQLYEEVAAVPDHYERSPAVTYEYGTTAPNDGRLVQVNTSGIPSKQYGYDKLGRITSSAQITDGQSYAFAYSYNADDSVATMTYPSTKVVTYDYDDAGRLIKAGRTTVGATQYLSNATYAPHGAPLTMTLGNGIVETTTYNSRLQPATMQAGSLLTLSFDYNSTNNNGNLLAQTITVGSWSVQQHYRYDQLNRLKIVTEQTPPVGSAPSFSCPGSGTGVWCRLYGYDRWGNRYMAGNYLGNISGATPGAASDYGSTNTDNRLTSSWAEYDAAGNVWHSKFPGQSAFDWTAAYDSENKQRYFCGGSTTECTSSTADGEYVYDGEGNRVQKLAGSELTNYVYDAFGRLAAEYSTTSSGMTSGSYFRTVDHLGSTRLVTDGSGAVYDRRDFYPFGEQILAQSTTSRDSGSIAGYNNADLASGHLFTAKERDTESGRDYFGARYFSASLGRFTSADAPFADQHPADPQSWNLYGYVRNNPLNATDPTGRAQCADPECETATIDSEIFRVPAPIDSSLQGAPNRDSVQVTFVNDDPNGASPNQPLKTETALTVEKALKESEGVSSVNINSTTGGVHAPTSRHTTGEAVDINRINGRRVDDPRNSEAVVSVQDAFADQSNIRENFGPARVERTTVLSDGGGAVTDLSTRSPALVRQHRNHVHASTQQERRRIIPQR